ncbi:hypothetical protein DC522_16980 [Microvirga sp. KLBC 81]|uniref:calcium-binding protein n=1 Tax=Microvirga sp. KLBC 81 TaxID=1862707 RepID=UPI000D51F9EC|nr:calcium-binding protein [Microvirga sp. KLBC 81]PVE23178.1 hypothetical protein DC522_16980 [Microvirga sp. KLBC 81]
MVTSLKWKYYPHILKFGGKTPITYDGVQPVWGADWIVGNGLCGGVFRDEDGVVRYAHPGRDTRLPCQITDEDIAVDEGGTRRAFDVKVRLDTGDDVQGSVDRNMIYADDEIPRPGEYEMIEGSDGPDTILSGPGPEAIIGRGGDDVVRSGSGSDIIWGGEGHDVLFGEGGDDDLGGDEGHDRLDGGSGSDFLDGGDGNDLLVGGSGSDTLYGGADADTASYADSAYGIIINLAAGLGMGGDAMGDRFRDVDNVIGSAHNDVIKVGTASAEGFDAAEYRRQNPDVDRYMIDNDLPDSWAYLHWAYNGRFHGHFGGWDGISRWNGMSAGADWGTHFDLAGYLAANPDVADYQDARDLPDSWVVGHYFANGRHEGRTGALTASGAVIDGGGGDDEVHGGLYSDYVTGGTGSDTIYGYAGWDVLLGGTGRDVLWGGEGNDQIFGGADDDFLSGESGDDTVEGGAGNDQVYGNAGDDVVRGNAGDDHLDGGEGAGRDSIDGGDGQDLLMGWDGDDLLRGEVGADTLAGGNGDDVLEGGQGRDELWGGAGHDGFRFHAVRDGERSNYPGWPVRVDKIMDFERGDWIRIDGTENVHVDLQRTYSRVDGMSVYGFDTIVTVNWQWQIVLEGYGGRLQWSAAEHTLFSI